MSESPIDYLHFNNDPTGLVPFAKTPCGKLIEFANIAYGDSKVTCPECLKKIGEKK